MTSFSPYTPLHHDALDQWGLSAGTRIWDATGNFVPIETLQEGDAVFGITFQIEQMYLNIHHRPDRPVDNIVDVWRPLLCVRHVKRVRTVEARAWQLTFGDAAKMLESRRLVAGADTRVVGFPIVHNQNTGRRLVDLHTAVDNPRTRQLLRSAYEIDHRAAQHGEQALTATPYTGTPRGDQVVIIPYELFAGQTGMMDTRERLYTRYLFSQVREVVPLIPTTTLYQLELEADQEAKYGASPEAPRCNVIAQTPFAQETQARTIYTDRYIDERELEGSPEELKQKWKDWGEAHAKERDDRAQATVSTNMQGMFYDSINDPKKAKALEQHYGIRGGWLNGGILIDIPIGSP